MMTSQITAITGDSFWIKKWDVASSRDPNKAYRVAQDKHGRYGCNCPGWKFRREQCRHIKEVQAHIGDTNPVPVAPPAPKVQIPNKPLSSVMTGQEVWVVVRFRDKAVRIKVEVVAPLPDKVLVASPTTRLVYEVPYNFVFERRPDKALLENI